MLWRGGGGYKRRQRGRQKTKRARRSVLFCGGLGRFSRGVHMIDTAALTIKIPPACRADRYFWWGMVDSNHRRHCQQIYSLSPLATREIPQIYGYSIGAGGRIRTPDLLITNQLLYQLSYTSISPANRIIPELSLNVNKKVYQETENLSL